MSDRANGMVYVSFTSVSYGVTF